MTRSIRYRGYELGVGQSYGDSPVYAGSLYPDDVFTIGFNTRWGGYFLTLMRVGQDE